MPFAETDNLFAAAKSYALAARTLQRSLNTEPALQLPIAFLAGFAFELSFKAAVSSRGAKGRDLKRIGHSLKKGLAAAKEAGFVAPAGKGIEEIVHVIAEAHERLQYRYVPNVEVLPVARPDKLIVALAALIDAVEEQFDVWANTPHPP